MYLAFWCFYVDFFFRSVSIFNTCALLDTCSCYLCFWSGVTTGLFWLLGHMIIAVKPKYTTEPILIIALMFQHEVLVCRISYQCPRHSPQPKYCNYVWVGGRAWRHCNAAMPDESRSLLECIRFPGFEIGGHFNRCHISHTSLTVQIFSQFPLVPQYNSKTSLNYMLRLIFSLTVKSDFSLKNYKCMVLLNTLKGYL